MKLYFFYFFLILLSINYIQATNEIQDNNSLDDANLAELSVRCSLVSFVYMNNKDNVYAAMALGKSFKQTHSVMDMNLIVYGQPDYRTIKMFNKIGWNTIITSSSNLEVVSKYQHSNESIPSTIIHEAIMAQFFPFTMTSYDVVVYTDPSIVVVGNIDELCRCYKSHIGSAIQFYSGSSNTEHYPIGLMTLRPSLDIYRNIDEAVQENKIVYPRDVFKLFYGLQECPYFDPLQQVIIPSHDCVRLPIRYGGDIIYHTLSSRIEQEIDPPKVLHYSIADIQPFKWWALIVLPEYWHWISSYITALDNVYSWFDPGIIYLFVNLIIMSVPTLLSTIYRKRISDAIYNAIYSKNLVVHCCRCDSSLLEKSYLEQSLISSRLIIFHILNFFSILLAFKLSDIYITHPYFDMLLFVISLASIMDYLLFMHVPKNNNRNLFRIYLAVSLIFFGSIMTFEWLLPHFLIRIVILILWFIGMHAIWFTRLLLSIPINDNQITVSVSVSTFTSSSTTSPIPL